MTVLLQWGFYNKLPLYLIWSPNGLVSLCCDVTTIIGWHYQNYSNTTAMAIYFIWSQKGVEFCLDSIPVLIPLLLLYSRVFIFIVYLMLNKKYILKFIMQLWIISLKICITYDYSLIRKRKCNVSFLIKQRDTDHCPNIVKMIWENGHEP